MMKVTLDVDGICESWQDEFPKTTACDQCGTDAMLATITAKMLCSSSSVPHEGGVHGPNIFDICAVAVYFCKECHNMMALYSPKLDEKESEG